MYFIGVDNGATRTRAVVLNLESATVAAASERRYGLLTGLPSGHREQDPSLWVQAADQTVRDCISQLGSARSRIAGLGVSGQSDGLVLLDAANRIVRPAKLSGDRSADRHCEELSRAFGGAPGLIELTGNPLRPSFLAPRLHWLKQTEPHNFDRVTSCLSPHDFLNFWLGGVKRSEYGEASASGLLDVRSRKWCRALADYIDPELTTLLPAVGSSREALGALRPELARDWGISEAVLLSAGGAEEMMTAVAAGAVGSGAVSLSTDSAMICGVSDQPVIDPHGEVTALCDATDRWMPLVRHDAIAAWARQVRTHYGWNDQQLEAALAASEPGAGGLLFVTSPERASAPGQATGSLQGITGANFNPVNVARASIEALALDFGRALHRMTELGFSPVDVRLSGQLSSSPTWRQILADVLGLPVRGSSTRSCPAVGAALQAAVTYFSQTGESLSYAELTSYAVEPEEQTRCTPDGQHHEYYRELMARQERLAETLRDEPF